MIFTLTSGFFQLWTGFLNNDIYAVLSVSVINSLWPSASDAL